jgi:hypothetical protein
MGLLGQRNVNSLELNYIEHGRGCVSGMIMEDPTSLGLSLTDNVTNPASFGI